MLSYCSNFTAVGGRQRSSCLLNSQLRCIVEHFGALLPQLLKVKRSMWSCALGLPREAEAHMAYGTLALYAQKRAATVRFTHPQINEQLHHLPK